MLMAWSHNWSNFGKKCHRKPSGVFITLQLTSRLEFTCRNCDGGDRGRVAIYRPFGEVSLSLNRTVTCMVLKANDRRTSCPCHDEFRGPRSDYVRQIKAHEIHSGRGLEVRLSLALSTIQVTVRFSSAKFQEGTIDGDTTYLHLQKFCIELKGREIFSSPRAHDSAQKTSDPLI
ncbi:uncharacterized protein TNCV_749881 [Trichonephila clavipes]|nr:uncharacterized protein TNCV_749881 [Trichonephila clavipes]